MKLQISKGMSTLIDIETYDMLKQKNLLKWNAQKVGNRHYVSRVINGNQKIYLHRLIMDVPRGMVVDHIDGDSLNNIKENLRVCYARDNNRNQKLQKHKLLNDYPFKGIVKTKAGRAWTAQIGFSGLHVQLGSFERAMDAARVYDIVAVLLFGEYAKPNFENSKKYMGLRERLIKELTRPPF